EITVRSERLESREAVSGDRRYSPSGYDKREGRQVRNDVRRVCVVEKANHFTGNVAERVRAAELPHGGRRLHPRRASDVGAAPAGRNVEQGFATAPMQTGCGKIPWRRPAVGTVELKVG